MNPKKDIQFNAEDLISAVEDTKDAFSTPKQKTSKCSWRTIAKRWHQLEERYAFTCKNPYSNCYCGACIEDWRTKKLVCPCYKETK